MHNQAFIANDCVMERNKGRFAVITGPNMGRKSTYIRQVAICAFLNQIGMFVPAERAEMPIFSSIMARVGASDAQLHGISTFMAEMLEASTILDMADSKSLVIVVLGVALRPSLPSLPLSNSRGGCPPVRICMR